MMTHTVLCILVAHHMHMDLGSSLYVSVQHGMRGGLPCLLAKLNVLMMLAYCEHVRHNVTCFAIALGWHCH